jgi:putative hydrolase of the HAD superfamily
MTFELLLFDLDGTLYDHGCGYEDEIHANIFRFMVETQGGKFDAITTIDEAKTAWQSIFDKYNLTKRGLLGEGYEFDGAYYDRYIREGADKYVHKDPELRRFLQALPQESRKVVFTNAPESSAHEILELLGVADLFEAVLGTAFLDNQVCKPERAAFDKVLDYLHMQGSPGRICYFEDSFKNLLVGKELGFATVFVNCATLANEGRSEEELNQFDAVVEGKVGMELKHQLPQLFSTKKQIDGLDQ